jgi:predicted membrane metal-binding protein
MKKILFLLAAFALFTTSYASSGFLTKKASEIYLPLGKNLTISLQDLSVIKISDYERLSGRHLNFFDKIAFKIGQKKLRHSFAADGTITNNQLLKAVSNGEPGSGFNIGWFALGLFTGLIGVLLSYIINGDEDVKRNRHKWAWIGWGVWVVIVVLTLL